MIRDAVVVVTGASSGFGELIARRCTQAGARVVLVARSADRLARLADELGARSGRAHAVAADVTCDDDVRRLESAVREQFGHVDVLINNAGFGIFDPVAEARQSDLDAMFDVNFFGATRCTAAFLPQMLERRSGQIIMMGSVASYIAAYNMGGYTATKHALLGYSRTLMLELLGSGVACTLICPGVARTGFQQHADEAKYPRISRMSACTPEQVAVATVRAIARRRSGEIVVPATARLFILAFQLFPDLARHVMRLIR